MHMMNGLPGHFPYIDPNIKTIRPIFFHQYFFHLIKHQNSCGLLFYRKFKIIGNMPFRDDQSMALIHRKFIKDRIGCR